MPTGLRIAGWKATGLRCPDHEVSFLRDSGGRIYPVTLIQMPNGTGKTTTLELLRAALSGSHPSGEWTPDRVRQYRKRRNSGNQVERGKFEVTLLHGERRMTVTLSFDFEEGTVRYATTLSSGMIEGFRPPRGLERFLRPAFVNFFIFDGELADHLLDHERTDAQTAVEDLFQLRTFARIAQEVQGYWDRQTLNRGATEERGLTRRRNRVARLRERIDALRRERDQLRREYTELAREVEERERRFASEIARNRELNERLQRAGEELNRAREEVEARARALFGAMRDPQALAAIFAHEMVELKLSLDRVKLPESTAREFFEELALEELCICGRPLDEATRVAIRERANQYLGSDNVALLNAIKADVAALVLPDIESHEASMRRLMEALLEAQQRERELTVERDSIEAEVVRLDPRLEEAKSAIGRGRDRLNALARELSKFDDPSEAAGDDDTFGIGVLERRLKDAERKLAEVTQTLELKRKRDVLIEVLEQVQVKARARISEAICEETNQRIARLMPHNTIRIERVERCLVLRGQEGGSVGETLSVAYAFLATLFNRTDYQLPFVVDSPANPIDLQVRPRIAELIPALAEQFIAFIISSERQGFVGPLERAAPAVQHITLFRKGSEELETVARREGGVLETIDGLCIYGPRFFHSFHLDEEEARSAV